MPKDFYTERDIEDMVKRGILSLELNDNVVLTDLAYEKANRLGMKLVQDKPDNPPAAPVRPYMAQQQLGPSTTSSPIVGPLPVPRNASISQPPRLAEAQVIPPNQVEGEELPRRIRNAVIARLGEQVDSNLLEVIISRVLQNTGIK